MSSSLHFICVAFPEDGTDWMCADEYSVDLVNSFYLFEDNTNHQTN